MAAAQLIATTISSRVLPSFEGLRSSSLKVAAFVSSRQGLSQSSFHPLVVKAATVVTPKIKSTTITRIGARGFGKVFFAELRGEKAAIKKMDMQASRELLAELQVLTHVHHFHLAGATLSVCLPCSCRKPSIVF